MGDILWVLFELVLTIVFFAYFHNANSLYAKMLIGNNPYGVEGWKEARTGWFLLFLMFFLNFIIDLALLLLPVVSNLTQPTINT